MAARDTNCKAFWTGKKIIQWTTIKPRCDLFVWVGSAVRPFLRLARMDSSLRITFEAFRQFAHRRARGLVAGHVARLILAQAGLVELLPAFHESVGAAAAASRRTEAWRAICSVVLDTRCAPLRATARPVREIR